MHAISPELSGDHGGTRHFRARLDIGQERRAASVLRNVAQPSEKRPCVSRSVYGMARSYTGNLREDPWAVNVLLIHGLAETSQAGYGDHERHTFRKKRLMRGGALHGTPAGAIGLYERHPPLRHQGRHLRGLDAPYTPL